jgi:CoA-transferase family III
MSTNRGKRALALDPKVAGGLAVRHQIVETADVLVENFRPSVPARLGSTIRRSKSSTRASSIAGYRLRRWWAAQLEGRVCPGILSGIAVFQGAAAGKPEVVLGSMLHYFTSALLVYGVGRSSFSSRAQRQRAVSQPLTLAQGTDDPSRAYCLGGERRPRGRARLRCRRPHRHPSDQRRLGLYLCSLRSFLCCSVRADWLAGAGARPAMRDNAQSSRACC